MSDQDLGCFEIEQDTRGEGRLLVETRKCALSDGMIAGFNTMKKDLEYSWWVEVSEAEARQIIMHLAAAIRKGREDD